LSQFFMAKLLNSFLHLGILLLVASAFAAGAESNATITFTLDFPQSNPEHYEITVPSSGRAIYISNGALGNSPDPETTPFEFTISDVTRQQLFELAKKANYFSGKVDSGNAKLANTGVKTLTYKDGSHNTSATYNYSTNPPVQQITSILRSLSTVLEYGRRLTWFHKYQKLALDDDLQQMEDRQHEKNLGDVHAIAPVLQQIADDQSVMRMSRARALRLLAVVGK
jgi:hypothetical protein